MMNRTPALEPTRVSPPAIEGYYDPSFARLRAAFEDNFALLGEVGASVCVYRDNRKVVELWGGFADPVSRRPWQSDTLVCMMSVGKSVCALSVLMLVERGKIDLDKPVAHYWPEFARAGKEHITVRTLLSAKAALLFADAAPDGSAYDWQTIISALEQQRPEWEPGTRGAYHSVTFGYLLGELVRRVDGRPINVFVAEEIERTLGIDYKFGLNDAAIARVADVVVNEGNTTLQLTGNRSNDAFYRNTREFRTSVFPSGNGHSNASSVARLYALLAAGGSLDGVRLISPSLMEEARTETWNERCGMTDRPYRYGLGFFLNCPPLVPFGPNPRAFGHPGAGGAVGFADPEAGIAVSYSPSYMCSGAGVGERCEALIAATFGA
jgi:CubicO group peptidase (beta-lactamase class C family)